MTTYASEPFKSVHDNFHLVQAHWKEIVRDPRELNPHWELFYELEKEGRLAVFVARDNDKEMIGYAVFILQPNLHSRNTLIALNDAVFLRKDRRVEGAGPALLAFCDAELTRMGVDMILWHVKPSVDFSGSLLKMGYEHFNTVYAKHNGGV